MGGRFEASWGLFFGSLGALFWASRGCGACWGPLGGPGGLSEASRGPPGGLLGPPVPPLGPVLGLSRGLLGPSWAPLGQSGGPLGPSWNGLGDLLGRLGAVLGASWAVLERRKFENARRPKTSKKPMKINDFGLLGPSRDASRSSLGASWGPLGPPISSLGPILGHVGAIWAVLGGSSRPPEASWGLLGASWGPLGPSGALQGALATQPPRRALDPGKSVFYVYRYSLY